MSAARKRSDPAKPGNIWRQGGHCHHHHVPKEPSPFPARTVPRYLPVPASAAPGSPRKPPKRCRKGEAPPALTCPLPGTSPRHLQRGALLALQTARKNFPRVRLGDYFFFFLELIKEIKLKRRRVPLVWGPLRGKEGVGGVKETSCCPLL